MLARRLALTLRMGAIIFAVSALALIAAPDFFLEFLKIAKEQSGYSEEIILGDENDWRLSPYSLGYDAFSCCLCTGASSATSWSFDGWDL